jgi:hypothetical protein
VLVHGRSNTIRGLNIFQNMQDYISNSSNSKSRTEQKNYSAALFLRGTISALNVMIPGLNHPHKLIIITITALVVMYLKTEFESL